MDNHLQDLFGAEEVHSGNLMYQEGVRKGQRKTETKVEKWKINNEWTEERMLF